MTELGGNAKKIVFRAAAALLLLTGVLFFAPLAINGNSYKELITSKVGAATGRVLSIDGKIGVRLLPLPTIKANGVRLSNLPGAATPDMARVEKVVIRVSLMSLLGGSFEVESVKLIKPEVDLQTLPDGRANWRFEKPTKDAGRSGFGPATESRVKQPGRGKNADIHLDSISVEGGSVLYRDTAGTTEHLSDIDAEVAAESLHGPYSARGTLVSHDLHLGFDVRLNSVAENKASQVDATLMLPKLKVRGHFRGLLSNLASGPSARGKLNLEGSSLSGMAAAFAVPAAKEMHDWPFSIKGTLAVTTERAAFDDAVVRLAATEATGKMSVMFGDIPEAEISLTSSKLDLDSWLAEVTASKRAAPVRGRKESKTSSPAKVPGERSGPVPPPMAFALPTNLGVSLDLGVDSVTYRGNTIRHAKASAALSGGEVTLNQLSAQFPGESDVAAFGFISAKGGRPVADLTLDAASSDPRSLLAWLGIDASAIPAERLRRVKITGTLTGTPDEVKVSGIKASLDTAQMSGAATARLGLRPAFGANLAFDTLDLDAYLPRRAEERTKAGTSPPPSPSPPAGNTTAPAPAPTVAAGPLDVLNTFDANLRVRAQSLIVGGRVTRDLTVDASLIDNVLTIRDATVADAGGAAVSAKGEFSGFGGDLRIKNLTYGVRTRTPAKLAQFLGISRPGDGARPSPLAISGTLNGSAERLTLHARNELGGAILTAEGEVEKPFAAPSLNVSLEGSHSSFVEFVNLFTSGYQPTGGNPGGVTFTARASGSAREGIALDDIRARLGPVHLTGGGRIGLGGERPKLTMGLSAGDIPLDDLLPSSQRPSRVARAPDDGTRSGEAPPSRKTVSRTPEPGGHWSREPFQLEALNTFDADLTLDAAAIIWAETRISEPHLKATLTKGTLSLDSLTGQVFGGKLDGRGTLEVTATPRAVGTLTVRGANIRQALSKAANIKIAEGSLDLDADLVTTGQSPHEAINALNGNGKMMVAEGAVQGFDLGAVNKRLGEIGNPAALISGLQAGLNGGNTRFKAVGGTFQVANGIVRTSDLRMVADSGQALAVGSVNLPAWTLDGRIEFRLAGRPNAPPLAIRMVGPINDPKRVLDIQGFSTHALENGAGQVMRSKVGAVVREFLPPPPQGGTPSQSPETPGGSHKPKDILKGILNDLARPK